MATYPMLIMVKNSLGFGNGTKQNMASDVFLLCYIFKNKFQYYEEHVLFVSNQIYYWVYKCTTHHYYTNIIKTI